FFFFQAEDGIRDRNVTGVQTCALPICPADSGRPQRWAQGFCGECGRGTVTDTKDAPGLGRPRFSNPWASRRKGAFPVKTTDPCPRAQDTTTAHPCPPGGTAFLENIVSRLSKFAVLRW